MSGSNVLALSKRSTGAGCSIAHTVRFWVGGRGRSNTISCVQGCRRSGPPTSSRFHSEREQSPSLAAKAGSSVCGWSRRVVRPSTEVQDKRIDAANRAVLSRRFQDAERRKCAPAPSLITFNHRGVMLRLFRWLDLFMHIVARVLPALNSSHPITLLVSQTTKNAWLLTMND